MQGSLSCSGYVGDDLQVKTTVVRDPACAGVVTCSRRHLGYRNSCKSKTTVLGASPDSAEDVIKSTLAMEAPIIIWTAPNHLL